MHGLSLCAIVLDYCTTQHVVVYDRLLLVMSCNYRSPGPTVYHSTPSLNKNPLQLHKIKHLLYKMRGNCILYNLINT